MKSIAISGFCAYLPIASVCPATYAGADSPSFSPGIGQEVKLSAKFEVMIVAARCVPAFTASTVPLLNASTTSS